MGAVCLSELTGEEWEYSTKANKFISGALLNEERQMREETAQRIAEARAAAQLANELNGTILVGQEEAVKQRICELQNVVSETDRTLKLAEAAERERRIETLRATIQECNGWFDEDARAALTNDVCNSIFTSGGLPSSVVSGPSASELLLAEVINANALAEIEVLTTTGMLLETLAARMESAGLNNTDECE